ncbi:MAG TPA: ABC transporter ATP-binding protein [Clostridiaceae bacterium]
MSKLSKSVMFRGISDMKTGYWFIMLSLAFILLSIRDVLFAWALAGVVDKALTGDTTSVIHYLWMLGGAALLSVPLQIFAAYSDYRFSVFGVRNFLAKNVLKLIHIPEPYMESHHSSDLVSRMTGDVSRVQDFMCGELELMQCCVFYALVPFFFLLTFNLPLTLIAFGVLPPLMLLLNRLTKPVQGMAKEVSMEQAKTLRFAQDALSAPEVVKSYAMEEEMDKRFAGAQKFVIGKVLVQKKREAAVSSINLVFSFLPRIILALSGCYFVVRGQISIGILLAFVQLSDSGIGLMSYGDRMLLQIRQCNAALKRIYEAVDMESERSGGEVAQEASGENYIEFKNVDFSYENREDTLSGLNFSVHKGEKVALVGSSGCGKSTVVKLIQGFYSPDAGKVMVQGLDVDKWDLIGLRSRMALVLQDAFLFPGTLRDNIACGNENVTMLEIEEAIRAAGLEDFIKEQAQGIEGKVLQQGSNLSGGQRQRITIARAMLRNAPILLMDEATSALDAQTEQEVKVAIDKLMEDRTSLIVSHRLATIRNADRILVMDGGKVVEEGTFNQLMEKGGLFYSLFASQTSICLEEVLI